MGKLSFEKVKKLFSPRGLTIQNVWEFEGIPFLMKLTGPIDFYVHYDGKKAFDRTFIRINRIQSEGVIADLLGSFISSSDFVVETHGCLWLSQGGETDAYSEHYTLDSEIPIDYIQGGMKHKTVKISPEAKFFVCLKWSEVRNLLKNPMSEYLKNVDLEFRSSLSEHIKSYHQSALRTVLDSFGTPSFDSIIFLSKIKELLEFLS